MKRLARHALSGEMVELEAPDGAGARVDELYISPGFIDLQVNGFAGVDFNSPEVSLEELSRAIDSIRSTGVRRFFPTVITGPREAMTAALRNLYRAQQELPNGRAIAGFHVEGPHISPEEGPRGAHPIGSVRAPDFREFQNWQEATAGQVRIVTLSAHWPQAPSYIEKVVAAGSLVSIGHTHATSLQIADAVRAGAAMSTHLGNGAHRVMPKFPNYIWDQLSHDELAASFIVDGIHVPAAFLKAALRAKTIGRSVLVTDASAPAGAEPGRYRLGEQAVDLTADGRVVLAGQDRLAGSALKMHDAVANAMKMAGLTLAEAVTMATMNPQRVAGLDPSVETILF